MFAPEPQTGAGPSRRWARSARWAILTLALGLAAAPAVAAVTCAGTDATPAPTGSGAVRLRPVDGGAHYYARFPKSLPDDPSYFPTGVWFESVTSQSDVARDKAAGLNLYVVLTANSSLPLVSANGMKVMAQHEDWLDEADARGSDAIAGWVVSDEIDMLMSAPDGFRRLESVLARLPAGDGRLRYNNYGKGVTFWNTDEDARRYLNRFQDVVSADNYWFTDPNICGESEGAVLLTSGTSPLPGSRCHRAANYGRTVDRLRGLIEPPGSRPVWAFVEIGHPFLGSDPPSIQPAEVSAAVWSGLIHGARGVVYFNHSFGGPEPTQHALREPAYAAVRAEVAKTNARIRRLAPVLNAPFVEGLVTTSSHVDTMSKYSGGRFYVFAAARVSPAQHTTFTVPCTGDAKVTVLGEDRRLPLRQGSFEDFFADGNAVHVYRIEGGSTCGLSAKVARR